MGATVRIAMWSGPRNLSTAMMRSFGARADTIVADEPFYAAYLVATGLAHPMREAIIAAGETDPAAVARTVLGPAGEGRSVFYQKHMTHHMLPGFPRDWFGGVRHAFLIRRPEDVVASYEKKREAVTLEDIGFRQQAEIFEEVANRTGAAPPVVDAADVLAAPEATLSALCAGLGLAFDPAMLVWPPGRRASDGVWAQHWYGAVEASTGFGPSAPLTQAADLGDNARRVAEAARPFYERLAAHHLGGAAA